MNLSLLIEAALRTLLAALAVGAGLRLLRVSNVLVQKRAWCFVLAAALLMPLLVRWQWFSSAALIRIPANPWAQRADSRPAEDAAAPAFFAVQAALPKADLAPLPVEQSASQASTEPAPAIPLKPTSRPIPITAVLWFLYLGIAALLLARLLYGLAATAWLWTTAEPVCLAPDADLPNGLRLRSSRGITSPAVLASGVILPAEFTQWDRQKLRVVLAHEHAHILQRDFYLQTLAGLHAALFWFSPLAWWLKRKLSDLGEAVSDRAGLEAAASRTIYAQILLEFAALPRPIPLLGVAMAHSSNLSVRMERFLNESRFHQAFAGSRLRTILAVLLVPAAIFTATALIRVEAAAAPGSTAQSQSAGQSAPDQVAPPPSSNQGITINNSGPGFFCASTSNGDWYAVVTDPKTQVSFNGDGSEVLNRELANVTGKEHEKFLWFTHRGRPYVVEDQAMVAQMESVVKQNEAIVKSLGSSQEAKRLGLQVEDGEDGRLLVTGASLGELLGKLGEEGGRIGEEWGRLGSEADSKMKAIIDESLSNGMAHQLSSPDSDSSTLLPPLPPLPQHDLLFPPPPPPPPPSGNHGLSTNSGLGFYCASSRDGLTYAVIPESNAHNRSVDPVCFKGDGASALNQELAKANKLAQRKFLWFSRDGKSFIIDDQALVAQMVEITKQVEMLGNKQEQLGGESDQLSVQMGKLSSQLAQLSVPPPDLAKKMADLDKEMAILQAQKDKSKNTEEWADFESRMGNLQGKIGALEGQIGALKGAQGAKMGELGAKMGALGAQLGQLGARQGALSVEAESRMKAIIDKALQDGKAHPVQ